MQKAIFSSCRAGFAVALSLSMMPASIAVASTDEAWEELRVEVEAACRSAAEDVLVDPKITVDPFGSESYGLALMVGAEQGDPENSRTVLCVFDKASRSVEIGTPF